MCLINREVYRITLWFEMGRVEICLMNREGQNYMRKFKQRFRPKIWQSKP